MPQQLRAAANAPAPWYWLRHILDNGRHRYYDTIRDAILTCARDYVLSVIHEVDRDDFC